MNFVSVIRSEATGRESVSSFKAEAGQDRLAKLEAGLMTEQQQQMMAKDASGDDGGVCAGRAGG